MSTLNSLPSELVKEIASRLRPLEIVVLNSTSVYLHDATSRIMKKKVLESASTVLDMSHSVASVETDKSQAKEDPVYARRALKILSGFANNPSFGYTNLTHLHISGNQCEVRDKTFYLIHFKQLTHLEVFDDSQFRRLSHLRSLIVNHHATLTSLIIQRCKIDEPTCGGRFWIDPLNDIRKYFDLSRLELGKIEFTLPPWHAQYGQRKMTWGIFFIGNSNVVGKLQFVGRKTEVRDSRYNDQAYNEMLLSGERENVLPFCRLRPFAFEGTGPEFIGWVERLD